MPWSRLRGETANFMYCCFFHRDRIQVNSATASARTADTRGSRYSRYPGCCPAFCCLSAVAEANRASSNTLAVTKIQAIGLKLSAVHFSTFPSRSLLLLAPLRRDSMSHEASIQVGTPRRGSTTARLQRSRRRQSRCVRWSAGRRVGGMGRYSVSPAASTGTHATFILTVCSTPCDTEPYHHRPKPLR